MATIETVHLGDLRSEVKHMRSGTVLMTDAPVDNHGKGEFFSPTDLVAASLGSCMLTLMEMAAVPRGIDIRGAKVTIDKIMANDPRRIVEIKIDIYFPSDYSDKDKTVLRRAAETCPVSKSLHPDLIQNVTFHYPAPCVSSKQ